MVPQIAASGGGVSLRIVDVARTRLPVDRLISSHIALDDINSGMDLLASASGLRHMVSFDA